MDILQKIAKASISKICLKIKHWWQTYQLRTNELINSNLFIVPNSVNGIKISLHLKQKQKFNSTTIVQQSYKIYAVFSAKGHKWLTLHSFRPRIYIEHQRFVSWYFYLQYLLLGEGIKESWIRLRLYPVLS